MNMQDKAEWVWNREQRSIGQFRLGDLVEPVLPLLEKLERYEDEDCDTYEVPNSKGSKLFVKDGKIYSIQCGVHFMVGHEEIIGQGFPQCEEILGIPFDVRYEQANWTWYLSKDQTLKVIVDDKGQVRWVIYGDWEPDPEL